MKILKLLGCCAVILSCLAVASGNVHGDVVYTITGFANNIGDPDDPSLAPEVEAGETYVGTFQIDETAIDNDPDPGRGSYFAITSGFFSFSGGYDSMVDFSGGEVVVQQDIFGGAISLLSPDGNGSILIGQLGIPFDSDALPTDPGTQFIGDPLSLMSLTEPTGLIVSGSVPGVPGPSTGPIVLTVSSAIPEPSTACILGLGSLALVVRRRK